MRLGVRDVLEAPCRPAHLLQAVRTVLAARAHADTVEPTRRDAFAEIIGTSPALQDILGLARRVGPSSATVLLEGESGSGKELIARAIQQCSQRSQQPFIRVNCAALPETLMESELFGHERGAFTGAVRARPGRFELADKGTLFLDEIGDMSLSTQTKLLRVLQEGEVDRVGGTRTRHVDVRVIAATNVDLEKAVRDKRFREDLYYRLRVVQLHVPSLRERRGDIPMLVEHFVKRYAERDGKDIVGVEARAMQSLLEYRWPGNVRELENAIERGVALTTEGPLQLDCLPAEFRERPAQREVTFSIGTSIADIERRMIAETLRYTDGDKSQAAKLLGITVRTIYRKLERRRRDLARWACLDRTVPSPGREDGDVASCDEDAPDDARLDTSRQRGS
jgi:two-component system response regulator HydG